MVNFDENDLVHADYKNTTTAGDDPKYTAARDRIRVNKKERYEVIHFCQAYVNANDVPKTKESFKKVEEIIRRDAARAIVMRDDLNEFVANNWY